VGGFAKVVRRHIPMKRAVVMPWTGKAGKEKIVGLSEFQEPDAALLPISGKSA